ncbi:MAG TPA: type II toxin-antitoxin system VapC family toxin [Caulobacteraceae bacterium]|nr:type II toxin-antitoxin system VapC family toxin [Caulobacteraceae bacterium]
MVIDTSALIAIELQEPERRPFGRAILLSDRRLASAASAVEFVAVYAGRGRSDDPMVVFDRLRRDLGIEVVPVDDLQWRAAAEALVRYGKGRHPARLNLGDSFAYALAKVRGEPLLYKGDDFARTDIVAAI